MNGFQLLDEQDNRIYFVFKSAPPYSFPLFELNLEAIFDRFESITPLTQQNVWILKKLAIICEDKISYFPDNELLIEPDSFMETTILRDYIILLFVKTSPAAPFEFHPVQKIDNHSTFEDAQKAALEKMTIMKIQSPEIEIKALGAKMIYNLS